MAQFVFGPTPLLKVGRQGLTHGTGGVSAPAGFILLVDPDGAYLIDADGAYLMEPV